jgi:hypothetical protein
MGWRSLGWSSKVDGVAVAVLAFVVTGWRLLGLALVAGAGVVVGWTAQFFSFTNRVGGPAWRVVALAL